MDSSGVGDSSYDIKQLLTCVSFNVFFLVMNTEQTNKYVSTCISYADTMMIIIFCCYFQSKNLYNFYYFTTND